MTSIFSKTLVAASAFMFVAGAAEAKSFIKQAGIDLGNGARSILPRPSPQPKAPPAPMSPCTVKPGACGKPGKG